MVKARTLRGFIIIYLILILLYVIVTKDENIVDRIDRAVPRVIQGNADEKAGGYEPPDYWYHPFHVTEYKL